MDVSVWWSVVLAGLGIFGIFLTTKKLYWGFVIGVFVQFLWVAYAFHTDQWGFLGSAAGYAWVNALGWWRWTRNAKPPAGDILSTRVVPAEEARDWPTEAQT